jgi:hypothetical protein
MTAAHVVCSAAYYHPFVDRVVAVVQGVLLEEAG